MRLRERQREKKREKLACKMKYLEGGSTGPIEQGGLKVEAAEAMSRGQAIFNEGERRVTMTTI